MAEIPRDIGALAKALREYHVEGTADIHTLSEMLRAFLMDVSEILDITEYELRSALQAFDQGRSRRARAVTRPLRMAQSLIILAARRSVSAYKTYLKVYENELSRNRTRSGRRFDPEQQ